MTELRRRMLEDMRLNGLSPRTQQSYVGAVARLARYYARSPDLLGEEDIRRFFLHLKDERHAADSTLNVYFNGVRFFFRKTLGREWSVLNLVRTRKRRRLPVVLNRGEVHQILEAVDRRLVRMALTTIYACGLRVSEAARLQVADIDGERMLLRVSQGKGGRDRYVPVSNRLAHLLRAHVRRYGAKGWLFPGKRPGHYVSVSTIQHAFQRALARSGVAKKATVHTLRHSFATSLLEEGVSIRLIQEILGHKSPKTTTIYTHVTRKSVEELRAAVDELIANPQGRDRTR